MIFLDTETTGLLEATASDLRLQPRIIELYAAKTDVDLMITDELHLFINPGVPIPFETTRIHGITDERVANEPLFPAVYDQIVDFWLGERTTVAHNLSYDFGMMWVELARMGMEFKFPWSPNWVCTVEKSMPIEGRRLRLKKLHEMATGAEHVDQHSAKADVEALITVYGYLQKKGLV